METWLMVISRLFHLPRKLKSAAGNDVTSGKARSSIDSVSIIIQRQLITLWGEFACEKLCNSSVTACVQVELVNKLQYVNTTKWLIYSVMHSW